MLGLNRNICVEGIGKISVHNDVITFQYQKVMTLQEDSENFEGTGVAE